MVPHRAVMIALLICAEVLAVTFVYQFVVTLDCQATDAHGACRLLRSMVARAMVVFAALVLLVWARPGPFGRFVAEARSGAGRAPWLGLHLLGLVLLALPVVVGQGRDLSGFFGLALLPWMLGGLAAAVGGVLWLAPARAWAGMLAQDRAVTLVVLAVAVLVPDLAEVLVPLWDWRVMTALTLAAVQAVLSMFGPVQIDPANAVIGIHGFAVHIARQCSGVEGIALVTAFAALYALVFRRDIRLRRYMLVVLPLAILFSWALNVVRIAVLILVGAYLSPEVAVNSFHSYAGWLFFTLVAMSMVWAVQMTPWLHRTARPGPEHRLRDDPDAALILPFVVFMLAGVLAGAFFPHPDLGYPLKVILLAVAVLVFVRVYWRMVWRPDAVTVLAGLAVGVGWLLLDRVAPDADLSAILSQMPESDRIAWAAFRIAGTVLLVPLIEEMFFRGYLLARLDRGGPGWRLVAIAVSSVLFAGLHGRWLLAGAAGVVFALVMLRRGRVTDAVVAHVLANLVIAAGAVALGNWGRI